MKPIEPNQADAIARLCPACGLCCNGVLFADVELRRGDDAARLRALGLDLFNKGRKRGFSQPCSCFDGKLCQIYNDRPVRCQTFECRLLKNVESGKMTAPDALKAIKAARSQVESVRGLVRELGQTNELMSLNERYGAIMAKPVNLTDGGTGARERSKLMEAMGALARVLEADFLA